MIEEIAIDPTPSSEEAAAIAAAIAAYRRTETEQQTEDRGDPPWKLAGRIEGVAQKRVRPPRAGTTDPWRMMERLQ